MRFFYNKGFFIARHRLVLNLPVCDLINLDIFFLVFKKHKKMFERRQVAEVLPMIKQVWRSKMTGRNIWRKRSQRWAHEFVFAAKQQKKTAKLKINFASNLDSVSINLLWLLRAHLCMSAFFIKTWRAPSSMGVNTGQEWIQFVVQVIESIMFCCALIYSNFHCHGPTETMKKFSGQWMNEWKKRKNWNWFAFGLQRLELPKCVVLNATSF